MSIVDFHIKDIARQHARAVGKILAGDVIIIFSPITFGLDHEVKASVEQLEHRQNRLIVILDTTGGVIDVVERMVGTIRHYYDEVDFIIPDRAMSAGTVFALSADRIFMNYYSYLGPIDPQVVINDKLTPALGYLKQYERLKAAAADGKLTDADAILLSKLDLADLYQYEQAREHSVELLEDWLSRYKFKNWIHTETEKREVTEEKRRKRAKEIADKLNETERWHSHGRGIDIRTIREELNLRIEDFEEDEDLSREIRLLFDLVVDYMSKSGVNSFVLISEKE